MKLFSNRLFFGGLIGCIVLIVGSLFFTQSKKENSITNGLLQQDSTVHPPSDGYVSSSDVDPWNVLAHKQADILANATILETKGRWKYETAYNHFLPILIEELEKIKKDTGIFPQLVHDVSINITTKLKPRSYKPYHGPQTADALFKEFHERYTRNGALRKEVDARFPPEIFLNTLLDKGVTIQNYSDYKQFMGIRGSLISLETNPEFRDMQADMFGIPISEMETLKTLLLDQKVEFWKKTIETTRADPEIIGGTWIGDKHLPNYLNREITYVQRNEYGTGAAFIGSSLTDTQQFNLLFRGIEPEGIEIIYIDESGEHLAEKPTPITREEFRSLVVEGETLPPEEWWDPNAPIPDSEDFGKFLPPKRTGVESDSRKQLAREEFENASEEFERQAVEVARQSEFKQFMQEIRQLDKFSTMSNAEITSELEKQLRQQLLPNLTTEENLEDAVYEKITPKPLTPERFNKAKQILQNHGPKEGLRRLVKADPELAEYFRRNPQKVQSKPSQPSNTDDSQME